MSDKTTKNQRTIATAVRLSGIGLHTGIRAHVNILPGPINSGIIVRRIDVEGHPQGRALATNVTDVQRSTTISCGTSSVKLVEHIVAALYAMNIDNVIIALDGPEPPVADGSSLPYVDLIKTAGIVEQDVPAEYCVIKEPVWVEKNDSRLIFLPHEEETFRLTCTVHYGVCKMDTQYLSLVIDEDTFTTELAAARTFCEDYGQVEYLMKAGLIRGASLDNAMVVRDGAIISKDGLRFDDELVRHKMLDIVGDLSLIGRRLRGHLIAIKPGHPLNVEMAQTIMKRMGYESEG